MSRLDDFQPSAIRHLHDLAQALRAREPNRRLIPLHFGESDLGTPPFIVEAGCQALRNGAVFYEDNGGRQDLKAALVEHYAERHGVRIESDQIVLSCGGVQAILLSMLGLVNPGDDVLVITPAWPNLVEAARLAGGTLHEVALRYDEGDDRFELDMDRLADTLARTQHPRLVVVNTPSNPTGWVASDQAKNNLVALCRQHGVHLLMDEMYDRILFDGHVHRTVLARDQDMSDVTVINGFSKAYCMTGWRLGYLVTAPERAVQLARMQEFVTSHAPSMAQVAAITALHEGEAFIRESLERYTSARDLAVRRLKQIAGAVVPTPRGAFYLFFRLPGSSDSIAFCRQLLEDSGVVLAPGAAFGRGGEGWVRLCFATQLEQLDEALERVADFVAGRSNDRS